MLMRAVEAYCPRCVQQVIGAPGRRCRYCREILLPLAEAVVAEAVDGGEGDAAYAVATAYATPSASGDRAPDTASASLRGEGLAAWDRREDVARALAQRLGLDFNSRSQWLVGGVTIEVAFWRDHRGLFVLRIWGWGKRKSLMLAEAFAVATVGRLQVFGDPELARWKRRMLVELGFISPAAVALAALPSAAPPTAVTTWSAVARLLSVRDLTDPPDEPFPFSAPWVAASYHVPEPEVRAGKRWLAARGFLLKVGTAPSGKGRPRDLWLAQRSEAS